MVFEGSHDRFHKHIADNSRPNTWTDKDGVMVAATALYLGKKLDLQLFLMFLKTRPKGLLDPKIKDEMIIYL